MRLDSFEKYRRCDYYDEVECAKKFLQDYLYNTNRRTDKKCLPPCKGVNFVADKVTVSPNVNCQIHFKFSTVMRIKEQSL